MSFKPKRNSGGYIPNRTWGAVAYSKCPVCGKETSSRYFDEHKKIWVNRHIKRGDRAIRITVYCEEKTK